MSYFVFNGINSNDLGLVISKAPVVELPQKKIESLSIPNRNGDLIIDNGGYEKITITFECYLLKDFTNENLRNLKKVFLERFGTLVLSDAPNLCYKAYLSNTVDITKIIHQLSKCIITFECEPFTRELKQEIITISSEGSGQPTPTENPNLFGEKSGGYKSENEAKAFWYADDFSSSYDNDKKQYVLTADGTKAYSLGFMCNSFINNKIVKGKTYTLSLDIKASEAKAYQCSFYLGDATAPLHYNVDLKVPKANEWVRLSYTFEALETSTNQNWYIYPSWGPVISITNLKVEEGTKDTGWNNGTVVVPPPSTGGSIQFVNDGDIECYPTFEADIKNKGNFELVINKEKITVLEAVGKLIIDSENYIITLDGKNYSHKMLGDFPILSIGKNTISYKNAYSVKFKANKEYV